MITKYIPLFSLAFVLTACGGGAADISASAGATQNTPATDAQTTEQIASQTRFLDLPQKINASTFGLTSANFSPSAVALKNDILYIGNDLQFTGSVLRYDLAKGSVLPALTDFSVNNSKETFNHLNDLYIQKDRLYTASLSSNRVDVFDLSQGEPSFITSLGTGNWSGADTQVLVHALAVAANDQYVFAADTHNRISVWKQSDVTPQNNKKAIKHAYLSLPGCGSISCDVKLEALGDRLYATFGNGNSFAYDVSQLAASTTEVQPTMQQNGISNTMSQGDDGKLYVGRTSGGIDSFNLTSLPSSGTQLLPSPLDTFRNTSSLDSSSNQAISYAKDISINNQRIALIQNQEILVTPQRLVREISGKDIATAPDYQEARVPAAQQTRVLQDGESWDTLTDPSLRSFNVARILNAKLNQNKVELRSYSAVPVQDLDIQARLKDSNQWFVLAHLDKLTAFSQLQLDAKVNEDQRYPLVTGQGSISFKGLKNSASAPPNDLFELRIRSKTDAHVQKLSNFKMKWTLSFGKYSTADGAWEKITPVYAREWVIMMTNFAYILNSPEFEHIWFNHKQVMGYDFFGDAGQVDGAGGFFTSPDYRNFFDKIMNRGSIRLGITTIGGGLGGGDILGIDTWHFYGHYFNVDIGVIGHEFGHHFGSHSSAWANAGFGLQPVNTQLHQYFQRKQLLPYMDRTVNNFHLTPRDQLYNGIATKFLVPRPASDINGLERYFASHPL